MIAALQVSLDGYTRGPEGEQDWVSSWADALGLIDDVDVFVIGAGMYPGYGMFWEAIHRDPKALAPFMERPPTPPEIAYAEQASRTPHVVMSRTLQEAPWPNARIVRDLKTLAAIKAEPGKNIYVAGGATLVRNLLNEGLIDELRLIVHPIALGGGQSLFGGLKKPLELTLAGSRATQEGRVVLTYRT
ncbi:MULTISPECIES: dihydrofolate reductase family protein [unclassified Brevundimonas]|uniref:dihydrofolate reductase family protein n=1 Tax=unclassified Brevundimonas TaxID=2622653 RepID=UPI0006F54DE7|nr:MULTISPECIES: dihydrofolate reductase family protein [unclassified Brevundimonas]KQY95015.1 hypothetical protein ASD25_16990 [Brevundimonas sp. Root1423]KRA28501.1 hypothetical protein ASD59_01330 [Brevundimonas sp. Root608]